MYASGYCSGQKPLVTSAHQELPLSWPALSELQPCIFRRTVRLDDAGRDLARPPGGSDNRTQRENLAPCRGEHDIAWAHERLLAKGVDDERRQGNRPCARRRLRRADCVELVGALADSRTPSARSTSDQRRPRSSDARRPVKIAVNRSGRHGPPGALRWP
jgi:hypothetical protein